MRNCDKGKRTVFWMVVWLYDSKGVRDAIGIWSLNAKHALNPNHRRKEFHLRSFFLLRCMAVDLHCHLCINGLTQDVSEQPMYIQNPAGLQLADYKVQRLQYLKSLAAIQNKNY